MREQIHQPASGNHGRGDWARCQQNARAGARWTATRKDGALAEFARLLRTPFGANVYWTREELACWGPLRGDPRFEALLKDPANNAPLLSDPANNVSLP